MNDLMILDRNKLGRVKLVPTKEGLSAIERASNRWWNVELPEVEESRHLRLMNAIRNIDPSSQAVPAPDRTTPWRPGSKWRYLQHEYENDRRRRTCFTCKQTGELTVSDGTGCVDIELCPICQHSNPFRRMERRDVSAF